MKQSGQLYVIQYNVAYRHNKIDDFASYNRTFVIKCAVVRPLQSESVDHRSKIGFIWSINFQKRALSVNSCSSIYQVPAAAASPGSRSSNRGEGGSGQQQTAAVAAAAAPKCKFMHLEDNN